MDPCLLPSLGHTTTATVSLTQPVTLSALLSDLRPEINHFYFAAELFFVFIFQVD